MSIRDLFAFASYYTFLAVIVMFLVWIGLKIYIVLKRTWSHLSGGWGSTGGRTAGGGRGRIGPRD